MSSKKRRHTPCKEELEQTPELKKTKISVSKGDGSDNSAPRNALNRVTSDLFIHHLDVGQGEATLLVYRESRKIAKCVLIDGGHHTRGGGTIYRYLKLLGINTIHIAICTHYDADHVEGLTALFACNDISFEEILHRGGLDELIEDKRLRFQKAAEAAMKRCKQPPESFRSIRVKEKIELSKHGFAELECIAGSSESTFNENNASLAFLLRFGEFRYYTGGDLEHDLEEELCSGEHLCAFKCGHHGSRKSTSPQFLKLTKPCVAFISCGQQSYCHPDDDVLQRLSDQATIQRVYLTNCSYNRKGVNLQYEISKETLAESDSEGEEKVRRLIGRVAGSSEHLGNIVLHAYSKEAKKDAHGTLSFRVGCFHGDAWSWTEHKCITPSPKSGTKKAMEEKLFRDGVTLPVVELTDWSKIVAISELKNAAKNESKVKKEGQQDDNGKEASWDSLVTQDRSIPFFSLLTKPPGEPRETKPLPPKDLLHIQGLKSWKEELPKAKDRTMKCGVCREKIKGFNYEEVICGKHGSKCFFHKNCERDSAVCYDCHL